ncbi:hypothetical protein WMF30_04990 [Sorangium sp. So ce134]
MIDRRAMLEERPRARYTLPGAPAALVQRRPGGFRADGGRGMAARRAVEAKRAASGSARSGALRELREGRGVAGAGAPSGATSGVSV